MAISSISSANAATSIAGVRAANDQVRALGQGLSSLIAVAEQVADQAPRSAASASAPASTDPARGQSVDISV